MSPAAAAAALEEEREEDEEAWAWSWGAGTDGQLGNGGFQDHHFPQPLLLPPRCRGRVSFVAGGGAHAIALTSTLHTSLQIISSLIGSFVSFVIGFDQADLNGFLVLIIVMEILVISD